MKYLPNLPKFLTSDEFFSLSELVESFRHELGGKFTLEGEPQKEWIIDPLWNTLVLTEVYRNVTLVHLKSEVNNSTLRKTYDLKVTSPWDIAFDAACDACPGISPRVIAESIDNLF